MKKIFFLLVPLALLLPACNENLVEEPENKEITLNWKPVFKNTKADTFYGAKYGSTLMIGAGDVSNCNCLKIKINYKSIYKRYYKMPDFSGFCTTIGFYFLLYKDEYTRFDTIICRDSFNGLGTFYLSASDAKIVYDTIIILKE